MPSCRPPLSDPLQPNDISSAASLPHLVALILKPEQAWFYLFVFISRLENYHLSHLTYESGLNNFKVLLVL